jgi:hypothetical protein
MRTIESYRRSIHILTSCLRSHLFQTHVNRMRSCFVCLRSPLRFALIESYVLFWCLLLSQSTNRTCLFLAAISIVRILAWLRIQGLDHAIEGRLRSFLCILHISASVRPVASIVHATDNIHSALRAPCRTLRSILPSFFLRSHLAALHIAN